MTATLRSRLPEPGAIVALGAPDGLEARIAEPAGVEVLYYRWHAARHFGLLDVGLRELGYGEADPARLVKGALDQQRLLVGPPNEIDAAELEALLGASL